MLKSGAFIPDEAVEHASMTPEQIARSAGFEEEAGRVFRTLDGGVQEASDWAEAAGLARRRPKVRNFIFPCWRAP